MTRFNTQLVHGLPVNDNNTGAVNPPIYNSSTYAFESVETMPRWDYARSGNPTREFLEKQIAQLEHGTRGFAFGSGLAAIHAVLSIFQPGDRIVVGKNIYGGTYSLLNEYFARWGVLVEAVDTADYEALDEAVSGRSVQGACHGCPAKAVYYEVLTNPLLKVNSVARISEVAHRYGALSIVDNTVPTPYLLRPIEFGADIVVHSTTKGITDHGNALGGMVVDAGRFDWNNGKFPQFTREELVISDQRAGEWNSFHSRFGNQAFIKRIRIKYLRTFGAVQSPFNAYMQLIGLETLTVREKQEVASATAIAEHLTTLPHVTSVNYVALKDAPTHDLACKYLPNGVGTILSFTVEGDESNVERILDATKVFSYVPNIGDSRSLIVNPTKVTHREVPTDYYESAGVDDSLIRLSIGLENVGDLIADLDQAIAGAY